MRLESIALGLVVTLAIIWVALALAGLVSAWPYGLIGLAALGVIGHLIYRVIRQKMNAAEDDIYEKTPTGDAGAKGERLEFHPLAMPPEDRD